MRNPNQQSPERESADHSGSETPIAKRAATRIVINRRNVAFINMPRSPRLIFTYGSNGGLRANPTDAIHRSDSRRRSQSSRRNRNGRASIAQRRYGYSLDR